MMDLAFVGLTVGLFVVTLGLVRLCGVLMEDRK